MKKQAKRELKYNIYNIAIVFKFLRAANLYDKWHEYLQALEIHKEYKRFKYRPNRHWSDYKTATQVFGKTNFTTYLEKECGIYPKHDDLYVYEIFGEFQYYLNKGKIEEAYNYARNAFIRKVHRTKKC
jgi:hypothetical protein